MEKPLEKLPHGARLAERLASSSLSGDPVSGDQGVQLLELLRPTLLKRTLRLLEEVAQGLNALEEAGRLRVADVVGDDAFVDATLQALDVARKTSDRSKREALRNAVLNAALKLPPDEAERHVFLDLIDRLSGLHLRILKAFNDPPGWAASHRVDYRPVMSSSLEAFLLKAFPELDGRRSLYDHLWSELRTATLVTTDHLQSHMSDQGWLAPRTSEMGRAFLAFIESPIGS